MFVLSWHFSPFEPTLAEPVVFIWHTPASVFCSETALLRTTRSGCPFSGASVAHFREGKENSLVLRFKIRRVSDLLRKDVVNTIGSTREGAKYDVLEATSLNVL